MTAIFTVTIRQQSRSCNIYNSNMLDGTEVFKNGGTGL